LSSLSKVTTSRLIAVALFALSVGMCGGRAAEAPKAAEVKEVAAANREKAKKGAPSMSELRKLHEEISRQRDLMIADFEVLAKQMKDATEEQKKQIKEKMEAQKKAFEERTQALHKQMREEQRKQRENAVSGKR
jgi:hypothetical protein